jgi:hypothetical protein
MTESRILDKLRKILALVNSPEEGEALAAAEMLQKLLTDHNLSMADLEKKGSKAAPVTESGHDLGKAAFKWKLDLAEVIAEHYFCHGIIDRYSKDGQVHRPSGQCRIAQDAVRLGDRSGTPHLERRPQAVPVGIQRARRSAALAGEFRPRHRQ